MKASIALALASLGFLVGFDSFANGVPIEFEKNSRTPAVVQNYLMSLFNQHCQGAIKRAVQSGTTPYTDLEDNYRMPGNRTIVSAHYDIVYDRRFPRDMVATISVNYEVLAGGGIKINAAQIVEAWDTSHCDLGIYK